MRVFDSRFLKPDAEGPLSVGYSQMNEPELVELVFSLTSSEFADRVLVADHGTRT